MSKEQPTPVVVQAVVVTQNPVVVQARMVQTQQNGDPEAQLLPPSTSQGDWRFDTFERACACTGDCWMAWCCPCFPLGQIAAKVKNM